VASNLGFQNINNIERTFSTLIGKPFFKQTKQMKWRPANESEKISEISHFDIETLQEIFEERHLLIHNPNSQLKVTLSSTEKRIESIIGVIWASDLVLTQFIDENIAPELLTNK
jgi:hypothetical protein